MPNVWTDEEVKGKLRDAIEHDDRAEISRKSGIGYGIVKRQFDTESDVPSFAFQFLQIACAEHDIAADRGDALVETFVDLYELSKPRNAGHRPSINNSLGHIVSLVGQVMADRANGNDRYEQLVKTRMVSRRIREISTMLLDEIASEPKGRLTPE